MLKILFLADAVFEDKAGGSRVVARELAAELVQRGHEVTFLVARQTVEQGDAPQKPGDEHHDGARIVRYSGAGRAAEFVRCGREACARLWAEQPFDIAHTHFAYAALGPLRAVPQDVPVVRSFYGPWDAEGWVEDQARLAASRKSARLQRVALGAKAHAKRALRHHVEAVNLRRSRRVIVLSEQSRGEVLSFGYPNERIQTIAGGVDVRRFQPPSDKRDKAAVRRELNLPAGRRILFSVRRLEPRMGLDNLIQAMPQIAAQIPNVLLLIGGKGQERERLEKIIERTKMRDHVRLVGFIPDEQLVAYYQAADAFVLPTVALEGFGLVTVESLACGTPVVGTPVGATPEILSRLDARLITAGAAPPDLAAGLLNFLQGEWARELTPPRLHNFVREHYTWGRHADAVEALYEQVLNEARSC